MTRQSPAQNAIRAMNRARHAPGVTCVASRHVAMIAEDFATDYPRPRIIDDPGNIAISLTVVVSALFEARHALAALAPEWANGMTGWWWTTPRGKAHLRRMVALNVDRKEVAP